jgi:UDP-GlcNAc:undecaprenyl-phosphate/decaprenyl-phosphate GlcNAc-1-phosphate transferase
MSIVLMVCITKLAQLSIIWVLLGQISLSLVLIMVGNLEITTINQIYGHQIELGYLAIPFTLLFLVGFTNVINTRKVRNPAILLLPFISLLYLTISAYIVGDSFVLITGFCSSLVVLFILLYGYFKGKTFLASMFTMSIGFIIGVLSISLIKISILFIYIPIFTLALPFTLYYFIQNKITSVQAITISSSMAILFGALIFIVSSNILWLFVVGITIILVIAQFTSKYRFV